MRNPRLDDSPPKVIPSDVEIYVGRIQWHARRILKPHTSASERMERLKLIISAAWDAHEHEVQKMDSLNSVKADPSMEVAIPE